MLDEQFGYSGWEKGREREKAKREGVRERQGRKREREREVIVRLCWVSSLGVLAERDIGKKKERKGEREIKIRGER
jgi:hypothetical protein